MLLRALGIVWIVAVCVTLTVAALVGTWFLFIGGLFDLFTDKMLTSGIAGIDAANREALTTHGGTPVGLVKVFVLEPLLMFVAGIVLGIANLIGLTIFGIGSLPAYLRERRRAA